MTTTADRCERFNRQCESRACVTCFTTIIGRQRRPAFGIGRKPCWERVRGKCLIITFIFGRTDLRHFNDLRTTLIETKRWGRGEYCNGSPAESPSRESDISKCSAVVTDRHRRRRGGSAPGSVQCCSFTGWDPTSTVTRFSICSVCTGT